MVKVLEKNYTKIITAPHHQIYQYGLNLGRDHAIGLVVGEIGRAHV